MKKINKAFKYRLRPTTSQQKILLRWMGCCRFIYNACLEHRTICYKQFGESISYRVQQNELPAIKKDKEFEWLKEVPSQSLQMSARHLDTAYKNFFEGNAEYPKPKKKGKSIDSITFPDGKRVKIIPISNKKAIVSGVPKLSGNLKFICHRPVEGHIKQCTITHSSGRWYISFSCITDYHKISVPNIPIGIDLGIAKTIALSSRTEINIDNQRIIEIEKMKGKIQQKKAKQKLFSKRWHYYNKIENKLSHRISCIRKDFLHKTTTDLNKNHTIICMEDLKVSKMTQSQKGRFEKPGKNVKHKSELNKSILRQGWGHFRIILQYKMAWNDNTVVLVPPKNTSRRCGQCGHIEMSNRKTQEEFLCIECGYTDNADYNAATNILRLGLESLGLPLEAPPIATA